MFCSHLGSKRELVLLLKHLGQGQRRHKGLSLTFPVPLLCCVYPARVALPPLRVSLSCPTAPAVQEEGAWGWQTGAAVSGAGAPR